MALEGLDPLTVQELAQLSLSMAGNPKTRKQFLKLTKEVSPGTPIPELDTESQVEARLAEEREARQKLEEKIDQTELKRNLSEARKRTMETYELSDEDMTKMEEMIGKKELPADYKWAAQLYRQQIQDDAPTTYGSSGWGPAELPAHEGLLEDPHRWAQQTAHSMIDEIKKKGHSFSNQ